MTREELRQQAQQQAQDNRQGTQPSQGTQPGTLGDRNPSTGNYQADLPNGGSQNVQNIGNRGGNRGRTLGNTFDPGNFNPTRDPNLSPGEPGTQPQELPIPSNAPLPDLNPSGPGRPKKINLFLNVEPSTGASTETAYKQVRQSLTSAIANGSLRVQRIGVARASTLYEILLFPSPTTKAILSAYDTARGFTNVVIAVNPVQDALRSLNFGLIDRGGIIVFSRILKDRVEGSTVVQDHPNEADFEAAAQLHARLISKQMYCLFLLYTSSGLRFFNEQFVGLRDRVDIDSPANSGTAVIKWVSKIASKPF
ncbi:MAG TPA: hypothetical protein IGS53_12695 [Leptolyngbyaceae cyanobacterium M33_DOE_097]|uniref:Uncharacterized protein n=1 Tax=Oscillatoriales cyanobacterium SpSt-418 TaxID=2282169 RepID=A0A7C3PK36_9CYAN|nr:hypothetical protein [Leptolyngbyaceae cyanobacterium M33_DOE_097]